MLVRTSILDYSNESNDGLSASGRGPKSILNIYNITGIGSAALSSISVEGELNEGNSE